MTGIGMSVVRFRNMTGRAPPGRTRDRKPETSPYTSVEYRGHRFYIADDDLESKSTFSMLNLVLALQAGELPSGGPVLTLPVVQ